MTPPDMPTGHLVLTGPMGVGKTTVGRIVADRLAWRFVDSDDQIEARFGITGRRVADDGGVDRLHEAEAEACRDALAGSPAVIAAAGSIADRPELIELLREAGAFVVVLHGDADVLAARARSGGHRRPLTETEAIGLAEDRRRRLAGVAGLVVDVTAISPEDVATRIVAAATVT